ncbi:uncharacterized protein HaLaN_26119 [Haematococcus lacustris]|uniref:PPM-type phosphatase domain-containing protein n=1 Tax=Haematococcus lacustris TaxID=44745 RepID=A0A6A0A5G4_HAELA|nr:uncharacterized protein HaLaN_26119 [Haematococcus lacustris]
MGQCCGKPAEEVKTCNQPSGPRLRAHRLARQDAGEVSVRTRLVSSNRFKMPVLTTIDAYTVSQVSSSVAALGHNSLPETCYAVVHTVEGLAFAAFFQGLCGADAAAFCSQHCNAAILATLRGHQAAPAAGTAPAGCGAPLPGHQSALCGMFDSLSSQLNKMASTRMHGKKHAHQSSLGSSGAVGCAMLLDPDTHMLTVASLGGAACWTCQASGSFTQGTANAVLLSHSSPSTRSAVAALLAVQQCNHLSPEHQALVSAAQGHRLQLLRGVAAAAAATGDVALAAKPLQHTSASTEVTKHASGGGVVALVTAVPAAGKPVTSQNAAADLRCDQALNVAGMIAHLAARQRDTGRYQLPSKAAGGPLPSLHAEEGLLVLGLGWPRSPSSHALDLARVMETARSPRPLAAYRWQQVRALMRWQWQRRNHLLARWLTVHRELQQQAGSQRRDAEVLAWKHLGEAVQVGRLGQVKRPDMSNSVTAAASISPSKSWRSSRGPAHLTPSKRASNAKSPGPGRAGTPHLAKGGSASQPAAEAEAESPMAAPIDMSQSCPTPESCNPCSALHSATATDSAHLDMAMADTPPAGDVGTGQPVEAANGSIQPPSASTGTTTGRDQSVPRRYTPPSKTGARRYADTAAAKYSLRG